MSRGNEGPAVAPVAGHGAFRAAAERPPCFSAAGPTEQDLLCNLANNLASFPPKLVPAAPGGGPLGSRCHDQVRRAAVSAVLRVRPREEDRRAADEAWAAVGGTHPAGREDVHRFLQQPWVRRGTPEILFIKRATRAGDRWSGHVAFPGGKQEPSETARQTAERETREELGLDLTVGHYLLGELDERKIESTFGGKLLMVLSSFVYLQQSPRSQPFAISEGEVASAHWIPLSTFLAHLARQSATPFSTWLHRHPGYHLVSHDVLTSARPSSRNWHPVVRSVLRYLIGNMYFWSLELPLGDCTFAGGSVAPLGEGAADASGPPPSPQSADRRKESVAIVSESSDEDVIVVSDDELPAECTADITSPRCSRLPANAFVKDGIPPGRVPSSPTQFKKLSPAPRRIREIPLTLWGLTLSVTSEILDMMHTAQQLPVVPLRGGQPVFDWWEVNQMLRIITWAANLSGDRRKPAGHKLATNRMHPPHHFHVRPSVTIPAAFVVGTVGRVSIVVLGIKVLWIGGKKLFLSML